MDDASNNQELLETRKKITQSLLIHGLKYNSGGKILTLNNSMVMHNFEKNIKEKNFTCVEQDFIRAAGNWFEQVLVQWLVHIWVALSEKIWTTKIKSQIKITRIALQKFKVYLE